MCLFFDQLTSYLPNQVSRWHSYSSWEYGTSHCMAQCTDLPHTDLYLVWACTFRTNYAIWPIISNAEPVALSELREQQFSYWHYDHIHPCHPGFPVHAHLVLVANSSAMLALSSPHGPHGHSDRSVSTPPHTQHTAMLSDTFLSWPATSCSEMWGNVASLWVFHVYHWALCTHDPDAGSPVFFPCTTFGRY